MANPLHCTPFRSAQLAQPASRKPTPHPLPRAAPCARLNRREHTVPPCGFSSHAQPRTSAMLTVSRADTNTVALGNAAIPGSNRSALRSAPRRSAGSSPRRTTPTAPPLQPPSGCAARPAHGLPHAVANPRPQRPPISLARSQKRQGLRKQGAQTVIGSRFDALSPVASGSSAFVPALVFFGTTALYGWCGAAGSGLAAAPWGRPVALRLPPCSRV